MVTYRFVEADTPALRRLPFERMESEGIARAVIWNRVDPCLLDWLECVNPQYALCWLAHDRNNALAGAVWLNPVMGLCGCVHFCIFKARHILRDAVVTAWAFQQEPYAVLWCALSDGTLAGLTYMPEQDVMGWHRHDTDGRFEDVAAMPGTPDDQTWFLVRRGCGLCVERLDSFFDSDELAEAYFLDSALNYQGAAVTRFSGLDHLAGRTVQVFADGGTIDGLAVDANGGLTLPRPASSVHAGLPYTSRLVPNLPEIQTQQGSSMMHNRKISAVRLRTYRSMSFLAGLEGNLTPIVDRHIRSGAFRTQPFFSDGTDLALDVCGGWADESPLVLEVNSPAPLTVLAISTAVDASPYSGKGGF